MSRDPRIQVERAGGYREGGSPEVLITVLTYRRAHYLGPTLESIREHLFDPERHRLRVFVNAPDPETEAVLKQYDSMLDLVYRSQENLYQGPPLTTLWSESPAPWVLHIEDDFPVRFGGWLEPALEFLRENPDIGQLRLGHWNHPSMKRVHSITREPWDFDPPVSVDGLSFARMNPAAPLTFNPCLLSSQARASFLPLPSDRQMDEAERAAQTGFHQSGLATAQLLESPFEHVGRIKADGTWGWGFGLHPNTRLGGAVRSLRLGSAKLAKAILPPRLTLWLKQRLGLKGDP